MKQTLLAAAIATLAGSAMAAPVAYNLDASHSQIVFEYSHLGFSTTYGMFSGFDGTIDYDRENPADSSVEVSFPVMSMLTGWEQRFDHFMNEDFFGAAETDMVTFKSTAIKVTGDDTAMITGDLTMNGVTKPVVLDTKLNADAEHPMAKKPWLGFDATTEISRTEFGLGKFAPFVGDEVKVKISVEAVKAD